MTGWIIETLVATTVLMLFVLMVRGPVAAAFGARAAYLLWLLPAARMILPPVPEAAAPAIAPIAAMPVVIELSGFGPALQQAVAAPTLSAPPAMDWGLLLLVAWLAGALVHFSWHLLQYRRLMRAVMAQSTPLPQMDGPGIEVCTSPLARGPFAAGIFVKTVVLPQDYRSRYESAELDLAMRHEMVHHLRCDLSANLAALAVLSLHWFNPLAYRAHRAFRTDQELACDAIVLDGADAAGRQAYAAALVKSVCDRMPAAACAIGAKDQLKRRLRMMGAGDRSRGRVRLGGLAVALTVLAGLAFTASGGIAAETARTVEKRVRIIHPDVAVPAVPAAPIAPIAPLPPENVADVADVADLADVPDSADAAQDAADAAADAADAAADAAEQAAEEARESRKVVRSVRVVRRQAADTAASAAATAAEAIRKIDVRGLTDEALRSAGCERAEASASSTDGKRQTRVMVCGGKGVDAAEIRASLIEGLSEARADMARESDLSAEQRSRIVAALDAKIAELRSRK